MKVRTAAGIGLAVAVVAGGIVAGVQVARIREHTTRMPAAPSTSLPVEMPRIVTPDGVPAQPLAPGCPDPAVLSRMPVRDKLAQLLMEGVTGEADARVVVADHHVGGVFIGSWTDLSMLGSGSLMQLATSTTPLQLAVSVDEEGGRVGRLSELSGAAPSARVLAQTESPEPVYQLALDRGHAMRGLGITVDFAPVVDVTAAPDDTVIGDRSFNADPEAVTEYAGAYSMRAITDRYTVPDAVLKALQAGADVALWVITTEVPAVLERLQSALHAGDLSMADVGASVLRVAAAKFPLSGCFR